MALTHKRETNTVLFMAQFLVLISKIVPLVDHFQYFRWWKPLKLNRSHCDPKQGSRLENI